MAHPGRLPPIFRSKDKNDRKDAERLAKLLYLGVAPAVHVPSAEVRTWSELITCRSRATGQLQEFAPQSAVPRRLEVRRVDGKTPLRLMADSEF
jgi:hypothetical protein